MKSKGNPINRHWQLDQDYWSSLNAIERNWLFQFNREFYLGRVKKGDPDAINSKDEHRKDCYRRRASSDRDLYATLACAGKLAPLPNSFE